MQDPTPSPFAAAIASRQRAARNELTARWLERIVDRVSVEPVRVFPTDDLLDHMPLLIEGIAEFVADPARAVAGQAAVMDRARELGALRFSQGFSEHELQKEYELLGGVLFTFMQQVARETNPPPGSEEVLACSHRLFQAISVVQQATTMQYLQHLTGELREREQRLEAFQRALTHEMRNRLGATLGAGQLLAMGELADEVRAPLAEMIVRNATGMRMVLDNLLELARDHGPRRLQRHVRLREAVAEAARQLREGAARAGVTVRIAPDLPDVEVNAAAVELAVANYLSNAIKYADPQQLHRWVEVRGRIAAGEGCSEVTIEVADNGLGVPPAQRDQLFTRFYRAHEHERPEIEGTGLGLSIVRETIESLGGRAWAEFPAQHGSVFALAMPCRRAVDPVLAPATQAVQAQRQA